MEIFSNVKFVEMINAKLVVTNLSRVKKRYVSQGEIVNTNLPIYSYKGLESIEQEQKYFAHNQMLKCSFAYSNFM